MQPQHYDSYEQTIRTGPNGGLNVQAVNQAAWGTNIIIFDGARPPRSIDLQAFGGKMVSFGRAPDNDIILESKFVSKHHGHFELINGRIVVRDIGSKNGTLKNGVYLREDLLSSGDILRIDNINQYSVDGVLMLMSNKDASSWRSLDIRQRNRVTIGRAADNDLVLNHVSVSVRHALIQGQGDNWSIQDTGSTNGVLVNGQRVLGGTRLGEKDVILITNTKMIFSAGTIYYCTYMSGIGITVSDVVKTVKSKNGPLNILEHVSLEIRPAELVAIIGGSGAGKTTLMNAICGYNKPTSGKVIINGEDLYSKDTYEALKSVIGYVPQQDIVYDNLTLFTMLNYAAKLRLPDDTTREEREKRVRTVIEMVELTAKADTMIRQLSGGQKKRASIAVELLSDPQLFFLDEPASGLDPGTERNLMRTLKNMTQAGKTVILVTHSTLNLQDCDKILFMGRGGNLCYSGNMESAKRFFGIDNPVDVYNMITDEPEYWRSRYDSMVNSQNMQVRVNAGAGGQTGRQRRDRHSGIRQVGVLSARYFRLMLNDRQRLIMLLAQAPLLAFLISLVKDGDQFEYYGITKSLLFALSCSAFWIGTLNAIQEVCKERVILRREYMTGLKLGPYIISKFVVLGLLSVIQSLLLTGVFILLVGCPEEGVILSPAIELFITTFLTAVSAAAMGIFASSMFRNPDRAMTVAPLLLMPQILFSGLLFKLEGATKVISWFAICRWSMEGYGTIANLNDLKYMVEVSGEMREIEHKAEDFFEYTAEHLTKAWLIMLAFVLIFAIISGLSLRSVRKDR